MSRTLALGLDGTGPELLAPYMADGSMPYLAALRHHGAAAALRGVVPHATAAAWASFATGASPLAHGVMDVLLPAADGGLRVATQDDLRRPAYYERLGDEGRSTVLVNVPLEHRGCAGAVIVNGWTTDDEERRLLPVGRGTRYRRLLEGWSSYPRTRAESLADHVAELSAIEAARFDLTRELFLAERWDHFLVHFSSLDWLGYALAGALADGAAAARAAMRAMCAQIDGYLGWLLEHAPDATAIAFSCWSQTPERAVVRPNAVLSQLGLVRAAAASAPPARRGLFRRRESAPVAREPGVDRGASRAVMPTDGCCAVYADEGVDLGAVREALSALTLEDGSPALEGVWSPTELGPEAREGAPALLVLPARGVRPSAGLASAAVEATGQGRGCRSQDGWLIVGGPVATAGELAPASLLDLAPTLLWASEAAIPEGGAGRVLDEAFEPAYVARKPEPRSTGGEPSGRAPSAEQHVDDEVEQRLRALGYL